MGCSTQTNSSEFPIRQRIPEQLRTDHPPEYDIINMDRTPQNNSEASWERLYNMIPTHRSWGTNLCVTEGELKYLNDFFTLPAQEQERRIEYAREKFDFFDPKRLSHKEIIFTMYTEPGLFTHVCLTWPTLTRSAA
jgi:hypothetical protein